MTGVHAVGLEWSEAAVDAAAAVICALAGGKPACICGGGCRRVAQRALDAALNAEREALCAVRSDVGPPDWEAA